MIELEQPPLNTEERVEWANWFQKLFLLETSQFATNKIALLESKQLDMKTAQANTIYTTKSGITTLISHILIHTPSASLAGGTDYDFTNFKQTVDLSSMTATTDYMFIDGNNTKYTQIAGEVAVQMTVNTGSTASATAYVDVFGYEV